MCARHPRALTPRFMASCAVLVVVRPFISAVSSCAKLADFSSNLNAVFRPHFQRSSNVIVFVFESRRVLNVPPRRRSKIAMCPLGLLAQYVASMAPLALAFMTVNSAIVPLRHCPVHWPMSGCSVVAPVPPGASGSAL